MIVGMNSGRKDAGELGDSTSDDGNFDGDDKHGNCSDGISNSQDCEGISRLSSLR